MGYLKGRAQVHNWNVRILIIAQLPQKMGAKPENWNVGDELKHKENLSLWNIIDTGDPYTLTFSYAGKVAEEHTVGREINEYVELDSCWLTEDEAEWMYKKEKEMNNG